MQDRVGGAKTSDSFSQPKENDTQENLRLQKTLHSIHRENWQGVHEKGSKKDLVISIILSWLDGEEGWTLDGWMVGGLWRQMISIIERSYRYVAGCSLRLQKMIHKYKNTNAQTQIHIKDCSYITSAKIRGSWTPPPPSVSNGQHLPDAPFVLQFSTQTFLHYKMGDIHLLGSNLHVTWL